MTVEADGVMTARKTIRISVGPSAERSARWLIFRRTSAIRGTAIRPTARMVIRDRKGIWTRYYTDKEGLKDWLLWKLGLKKETVFDRMKRMGVTGDVLQDMELLSAMSPIWMRKRLWQQHRMKERQNRDEFEIRKAK